MTEEEWLASSDVNSLSEWLQTQSRVVHHRALLWAGRDPHQLVPREVRLFACGCCRLAHHLLLDSDTKIALEVAEAFADGHTSFEQLEDSAVTASGLYLETQSAPHGYATRAVYKACEIGSEGWQVFQAWQDVGLALEAEAIIAETPLETRHELLESWAEAHLGSGRPLGWSSRDVLKPIADLLRCIVGNPFRPVSFDPAWRTETTVGLALRMYDDRDFAAMPILADALEEAGCDNADVLAHCREPGPHARGCWVVDGLLGKR